MERLRLCFGVHNHQPVGNFESVLEEATERAYGPFLQRVRAHPDARLTVHFTGSLLAWLREHSTPTFDLVGELVARGQVELLTGGFYEPILAILPDEDKRGQIERLTEFIRAHFGVRPRGMWLAERVWEPQLPRALRQAGVEYVLVDDTHFGLAGFDAEAVGGYYLTEDQGSTVAVFPISQRMRYLTPFAEVEESLRYLDGRRRGHVSTVTVVDDGEKFGAWPGTHQHVYVEGWLDRFFDQLLSTPWLVMSTFAEALDAAPPTGRAYLPTASYREMGEWVLSPASAALLASAKRTLEGVDDGPAMVAALRGGFWRGFLVKYPEVADLYWKMLRLSGELRDTATAGGGDLAEARDALWRGQANDAYWHGVFGGCYLPHLRRALKGALLTCERAVARQRGGGRSWWRGDVNGDGREEIVVRTEVLVVTLNPEQGGTITELGFLPRALDLADVFTRRPEAYHGRIAGAAAPGGTPGAVKPPGQLALLGYDEFRRASLMDGVFPAAGALDALAPWSTAQRATGAVRFAAKTTETDGAVTVCMTAPGSPVREKAVRVHGARAEATYRVALDRDPTRFGVQWNLSFTAGDAPGRYLDLPGQPSLGSRGEHGNTNSVVLVDEWIGVEAELRVEPAAELSWAPVETVSLSEGGFDRIHQGLALLFLWPLPAVEGRQAEVSIATSITVRGRNA